MQAANSLSHEAAPTERKRKSVAFTDGATIVDSDGQVTETNGHGGDKESAKSHATGESLPLDE